MPRCRPLLVALCLLALNLTTSAQAGPSEMEVAAQVDRLILDHLHAQSVQPVALTNDEDFLRRVHLDLAGAIPSAQEVTTFGLDPAPDKRSKVINQLLENQHFAQTWATYWGDVIFMRATEQRSRLVEPAFEKWMQSQLENNRPWNEVARELITATGNVREDGQTGLIFAHTGEPEELAAEISRVFLGIQISCANCHDDPTDGWKREQFHQLAAFLPRITVRPESPGDVRSFAVKSLDDLGRGAGQDQELDLDQLYRRLDRNHDGKLSKEEARGPLANRFDKILANGDRNKDGMLSKEELKDARLQAQQQPGRGSSEYHMPDLSNPSSPGKVMQPVFFLKEVKGPKVAPGAPDTVRRNALATYVTAPSNPWFARAFVNRIWSELLGQGFYMPVDDMGPERTAIDEDVLDLLSKTFVASGYDVKWLYRTIANTQAYQRQICAKLENPAETPFAAAQPSRLRSDQIYNSLFQVLGIPRGMQLVPRTRGAMAMQAAGLDPQKAGFATLFGFDPSIPQDDLLGNVPQALFMMNSPQLASTIRNSGNTRLSRILEEQSKDDDALDEVYLLVLSRNPTSKERDINQQYIKQLGRRSDAFEDILWSLLNSTEFLSRR